MSKEHERHYGGYRGDKQIPEDPTRCIEEVVSYATNFPNFHQCRRKRGYGPDGNYCKQHAKLELARTLDEVLNQTLRDDVER